MSNNLKSNNFEVARDLIEKILNDSLDTNLADLAIYHEGDEISDLFKKLVATLDKIKEELDNEKAVTSRIIERADKILLDAIAQRNAALVDAAFYKRQLDAVDANLGAWEPEPGDEVGCVGRIQTIRNLLADREKAKKLAKDNNKIINEIRSSVRHWLPIEEWGPVCAGCGGEEYRIDGFCSIECRDYHCDDRVKDLLAEIDKLNEDR